MVGLLTGLFILYTKNNQWLWLANRRSTPEEIPSSPEWDDDIIPYSKMVRPSTLLSPEEDRSREFPASFLVNKIGHCPHYVPDGVRVANHWPLPENAHYVHTRRGSSNNWIGSNALATSNASFYMSAARHILNPCVSIAYKFLSGL